MKTDTKQAKPRRTVPNGFWGTPKGKAILARREQDAQRETWRRFETWG